MWSAFKSNVKRMLQERMPDFLRMDQAAVLPVYEQRVRELEVVAGNAIAILTPNMLTSFSNRVEKKHYPMAMRQDDIKEKFKLLTMVAR